MAIAPPQWILASPVHEQHVSTVILTLSSEEASVAGHTSAPAVSAQTGATSQPPVPPSAQRRQEAMSFDKEQLAYPFPVPVTGSKRLPCNPQMIS